MHRHQCEILHHISECSFLRHQGLFSISDHLNLPLFADWLLLSLLRLSFSCAGPALSFYTLQQLIPT